MALTPPRSGIVPPKIFSRQETLSFPTGNGEAPAAPSEADEEAPPKVAPASPAPLAAGVPEPPHSAIHSSPRPGEARSSTAQVLAAQVRPAPPRARAPAPAGPLTARAARTPSLQHPQDASEDADRSIWSFLTCCWTQSAPSSHKPLDEESGGRWAGAKVTAPFREGSGLLPPQAGENAGRKCLVLDLDETLVHSSFRETPNPDYVIPVEIDAVSYNVYVQKRPGADEFLREMGKIYEVVVFTASLSKYADPLLDQLDQDGTIAARLFRESCTLFRGNYVKDMSQLGRPLGQSIIVDNSELSFQFHPENAIHCTSFFDDLNDGELPIIGQFLKDIADVEDVRDHLGSWPSYLAGHR